MTTFIKTKFKKSDDQTNIDKYRVAANITEYQNNLQKFMEKRQLFHVKNQQVSNGLMDILVTIIELLRFLHCT